ncbi:MAG: Ig-like domain-containing protein [Bacteroidales bacterium]|nr:Ig-like domain-containing protein [Bacteroidales bacterium]
MTRKNLWIVLFASFLLLVACQKAPELTITSSSNIEFSADGSIESIAFNANRDWSIIPSDSWVSVSPSSGKASNGLITVTIHCNANTTYEDRSAMVTIRMEELSQSVTIQQPANKGVVLPKQVYDLQSDAKTIDVEVQANVQYTVSTSVNWIKQIGTKGLTSKTLTFSVEENKAYDPREGKITIKPQEGNIQEQIVSIKQAQKDALIVEKNSYDMPYGGGVVEIKVEANVSFEATTTSDWIHHSQTKALSSSTVVMNIDENSTYNPRQGKVEIKQINGSLRHTITINQDGRIAVSSVELNETSLKINVGGSETLVATVKPNNATDKTISWTSSDNATVSVDEVGKITGIKEGAATITAKAGDKTVECKVLVCIPVSSVELDKTEYVLALGETAPLVATVKPENATDKTVTWISSNPEVATVDEAGKITAVKEGVSTITAKAGDRTARCSVTVYCIPVTSVELNKTNLAIVVPYSERLVATVNPDNATDKTLTWSSSDYEIATVDYTGKVTAVKQGTATITAKSGERSAACSVVVYGVEPPDAVDLGLSVKWASFNIGVTAPEEYGFYYFAWGETETKSSYSWSTYKWANGASNKLTKYCSTDKVDFWDGTGSPDGKTVLDPEDDVAHVKLGGRWRMPTYDEWMELYNNCRWIWTSRKGVNGIKVISIKNGNSIFLPAGGKCDPDPEYRNLYGYYWSASINCIASFGSGSFDVSQGWTPGSRYKGFSVRPVTE